ncbi:MAG: hypothetical protein KAR44_03800 [Candidatus Aegiribacteria sp.]|nr:hypothetical protein [Candidatus Aegiribacteria sp.]
MTEYPIPVKDPDGYCLSVSALKKLVSLGEYLRAFDLGDEYLKNNEIPNPEIVKQHTLCMSKLGMIDRAINLLESMDSPDLNEDNELKALLGSFYKRKWLELKISDPENALAALVASFKSYMKSREQGGDFWCIVNAASLALVLGKKELSIELADEVITQCWDLYNKHGTTSEFWVLASMGEAYLIKGDYKSAVRWFKGTRSHVGASIGQVKTTRTNAKMLLDLLETDDESAKEILECIRKPRIAIFAGHRIDRLGRTNPRFPEHITDRVKTRLKKKLIEMKLDIGIASAADGADILFHECLQEMGKRTHVILPSPIEHFRTKILKSNNENWIERFDIVIQQANEIEVSSTSRFASDAIGVHQLSSDYMLEYSLDLTEAFDGELVPVVVWDKHSPKSAGGTGYIVSSLRKLGYEPFEIPLKDLVKTSRNSDISTIKEFPYAKLGIYESILRPIIVIRTHDAADMEEDKASNANSILRTISNLCETESLRILNSGSLTENTYLIMNSINDARILIRSICDCSPQIPEHSLVLHAGLTTMLNSSLTGRRDYYSREIDEALELAASLRIPTRIVTMQFKSIASRNECPDKVFIYSGRFRSKNGNLLKIFQLPS